MKNTVFSSFCGMKIIESKCFEMNGYQKKRRNEKKKRKRKKLLNYYVKFS